MLRAEVADALNEIADILDILGDRFRPRAYRRAARSAENSTADLVNLMESNELTTIPGVGKNIALKIQEFIQTGRMHYLQKLRQQIPPSVAELLRIPDVGPKTALLLHKQLGISSIEELEQAVQTHKLKTIKGMGEKTEENILRGINLIRMGRGRMLLGKALPIATEIKRFLESLPGIDRISLAGSIRRMKETVGDVDILATADSPAEVMECFISTPMVRDVLVKGDTKSSVLLGNGLQVDLRIVPDDCFGSALQYFTGSKDHNIKLREIAQRKEMKLSEYGLFNEKDKRVAGKTEESIYQHLGMSYIDPELRENNGEIDAAIHGTLPHLVSADEILGDFHIHSSWSDGRNDIQSIALKAREMGYDFICITDHSKTLRIAHGLDEGSVLRQMEEIEHLNTQLSGNPTILSGLEVDIKPDGSLDTSGEVLEQLDVVIGSVHSRLKSDRTSMTQRVVQALSTGLIDILGHPTGRLLGRREPYALDEERVFDHAAQMGTWMEINAFPDRLDLNEKMSRRAAELGLKMAIGTDSHDLEHLRNMAFGVAVARRAWLSRDDVANCMTKDELLKALHSSGPN